MVNVSISLSLALHRDASRSTVVVIGKWKLLQKQLLILCTVYMVRQAASLLYTASLDWLIDHRAIYPQPHLLLATYCPVGTIDTGV